MCISVAWHADLCVAGTAFQSKHTRFETMLLSFTVYGKFVRYLMDNEKSLNYTNLRTTIRQKHTLYCH